MKRGLPEQSIVIGRVFHLRRNGFNLERITEVLNLEGFRTKKGHAWTEKKVSKILRRKP